MVDVTQADIAAARQLVGLPADASAIPHDPAVQAFARHRTATTAALTAERDALVARVAELEGVLAPFAFLEMEKDVGLADTQYVWETIYSDRVQDWFAYEDIEAARKALADRETNNG